VETIKGSEGMVYIELLQSQTEQ